MDLPYEMLLDVDPAVHGVIDISQTDVKGRITTIPYLDAPTETSCKSFIEGIVSLIGNSVFFFFRVSESLTEGSNINIVLK